MVKINYWMLGIGLFVVIGGILSVYYSLTQPCEETTIIEGNQYIPEVKISQGMSRIVCITTQPLPLILSLLGTIGILVGFPLVIKSVIGKQ